MEVVEDMGPEAGSEAFPCFLPPSHGSQIAFLPPRLCYSIFPYKLPFAPVTSSQKPRLIPFLIFPLPPPHLVFIPCISSLFSLGFSGLERTSSPASSLLGFLLLFPPLILLYLCILMLTPPVAPITPDTPITPITLASDILVTQLS